MSALATIEPIPSIEAIQRTDVSMDYSGLNEQQSLERLFIVGQAYKASIWWMIDGMRYMVFTLGVDYTTARDNTAQITGNDSHTVDEWWDVGEVFPTPQSRVPGLTYSHHKKVKAIKSPEIRHAKLIEARDKGWGSDTLGATLSKKKSFNRNGNNSNSLEAVAALLPERAVKESLTAEDEDVFSEPSECQECHEWRQKCEDLKRDNYRDTCDLEAEADRWKSALRSAESEVERLQGVLASMADYSVSLSEEYIQKIDSKIQAFLARHPNKSVTRQDYVEAALDAYWRQR